MVLPADDIITRARTRSSLPSPPVRRLIREQSELTQSDIALALGVHRTAVCRYESGDQNPRGATREAYAALLDRLRRQVLS